MPLVNPWARPAPTYPTHSKEFDCGGGETATLTLRQSDLILASKAGGVGADFAQQIRQEDGRLVFPTADGPYEVTEDIIEACAMIETMQVGAERYTIPMLLGFVQRLPLVFLEMSKWARQIANLLPEEGEAPGNAPGAATTPPSTP